MKSGTMLVSLFRTLTVSAVAVAAGCASTKGGSSEHGATTLHGYVLDSACAFIKDLDKPISRDCAIQCAQAGSPLVILADDGTLYLPISDEMPAVGLNARLLEFAGERVIVSGTSYMKGDSCAFVIEKIEHEPATMTTMK